VARALLIEPVMNRILPLLIILVALLPSCLTVAGGAIGHGIATGNNESRKPGESETSVAGATLAGAGIGAALDYLVISALLSSRFSAPGSCVENGAGC
jgi:hypothetical protein